MIKIRLRRTGSKKAPHYRVVVAPSTAARDGRFIEIVGHYHTRENPPRLVLKEDRVFHWLSVGAQPSDSFKRVMESNGTLERFKQFKAGDLAPAEATSAETTPIAKAVEVVKTAVDTVVEAVVDTEDEAEIETESAKTETA